jgi:hypothetical protein
MMFSSVLVITPATQWRLTTPEALVARLGSGDPTSPQIISAVDGASAAIAGYTRTVFGRETVAETFRVTDCYYDWPHALVLARRPVYLLESVTGVDGAIDSTEFDLVAPSGILLRTHQFSLWSIGAVTVTYTSGWLLPEVGDDGTLPRQYQEAAILAAIEMAGAGGRDRALRSVTTEGVGSYTYDTTAAEGVLPGQVRDLLSDLLNYRP